MLCEATSAPVAMPKRIARSTAPRFNTGSVPGSARSTTLACEFGSAPNCGGGTRKDLARGRQLRMRFNADDDFPLHGDGQAASPFQWTSGHCVFMQQSSRFALLVTVRVPRCLRHRSMLTRLRRLLYRVERGRHVLVHDGANVGGCRFIQSAQCSHRLRVARIGLPELQQAVRSIGHRGGAFVQEPVALALRQVQVVERERLLVALLQHVHFGQQQVIERCRRAIWDLRRVLDAALQIRDRLLDAGLIELA